MSEITTFSGAGPNLNGAQILVIGGTGSFGRAFIGHVLEQAEVSRNTIVSADRCVIMPAFVKWGVCETPPGSRPVSEGFCCPSDQNPDRLDAERLHALLRSC